LAGSKAGDSPADITLSGGSPETYQLSDAREYVICFRKISMKEISIFSNDTFRKKVNKKRINAITCCNSSILVRIFSLNASSGFSSISKDRIKLARVPGAVPSGPNVQTLHKLLNLPVSRCTKI
jgi:hypothetical protein